MEGPGGLFSALSSSSLSAVSSLNTASFRDRVRVLGLLAFGSTILLQQWGRMGQLSTMQGSVSAPVRGFPPPGNMSSHADMYFTWQRASFVSAAHTLTATRHRLPLHTNSTTDRRPHPTDKLEGARRPPSRTAP